MNVFGYIDETTFLDEKGKEYCGIGMFLSQKLLGSHLVGKAIENLKLERLKVSTSLDDRTKKKEEKVISSGGFHATDDTYSTKLSFIKTLNDNVSGHFGYSILKKKEGENVNGLQNKAMELCLVLASHDFYDVSILIEAGSRLNSTTIKTWEMDLYQNLERSVYNTPLIPLFFPKLSLKLIKKTENNFGLQAVDYLLWVYQRANGKKQDHFWSDHLRLHLLDSFKDELEMEFGGNSYLNEPLLSNVLYYPEGVSIKGISEDVRITFSRIESVLSQIVDNGFNARIEHIRDQIESSIMIINRKDPYSQNQVILIASTFIKVFDNYPVYEGFEENLDEWNIALYTRKIASLLVQKINKIHIMRSIDAIVRFKKG